MEWLWEKFRIVIQGAAYLLWAAFVSALLYFLLKVLGEQYPWVWITTVALVTSYVMGEIIESGK